METMTSIEEDLREAEEAAKVMIKGMGHHGAYFHAYSHPAKDLGESIVTMVLRVAIARQMDEALRN